jgi:hypothetical protein
MLDGKFLQIIWQCNTRSVCGRIHGNRVILARNNRDHGRTGNAEGCDHQDERSPFHGRSLVSFENISDCNCQLCISDVIVVAETTILLNFYAGKLPVAFPIWTAESGHCVARIERPPRANSGLGALFDQLIGTSQQPVWFIDLAVLRLVDSLKRTRAAQWVWRHAI